MRNMTRVLCLPNLARLVMLAWFVCGALSFVDAQTALPYPAPKHLGEHAQLGRNIQRTMTLLATSSPTHRNKVRILFYGQSITEQEWWHAVADDLRRRFPYADLVIENRALGGFSSQLLVKTAETDLYSYYPDLMIFHVYGAHNDYEDIDMSVLRRIVEEPPFRLPAYFLVKRFARSVRLINRWGAVDRPHYLAGVLAAADMAKAENIKEISVFEFGVAGGSGLVRLQEYAQMVEEQTGVNIHVFGFDTGEGLPLLCNDYRDHPDQWRVSDYKMDVPKLRERLTPRTGLYLGNITDTLPDFVAKGHPPVGFIACDVDLYSSTRDVLKIFTLPGRKMLRGVFMYFDDIDFVFNHQFAGEWLAIDEFNEANALVKIDVWRGIRKERVFFDEPWLDKMFIAHDLDAINKCVNQRPPSADCALV